MNLPVLINMKRTEYLSFGRKYHVSAKIIGGELLLESKELFFNIISKARKSSPEGVSYSNEGCSPSIKTLEGPASIGDSYSPSTSSPEGAK